jgi:hypothetical protein
LQLCIWSASNSYLLRATALEIQPYDKRLKLPDPRKHYSSSKKVDEIEEVSETRLPGKLDFIKSIWLIFFKISFYFSENRNSVEKPLLLPKILLKSSVKTCHFSRLISINQENLTNKVFRCDKIGSICYTVQS